MIAGWMRARLAWLSIAVALGGCHLVIGTKERTRALCEPAETRCSNGVREICDAEGTAFVADPCGLATPACVEGECSVCEPGTLQCGTGGRQRCNASGTAFDREPCPEDAPVCTGTGECVGCATDGVIVGGPLGDDPCHPYRCEDGKRIAYALAPGVPCELARGNSWNMSCARTSDDDLYCWGANLQGQLGTGSEPDLLNAAGLVSALPPIRGAAIGCEHVLAWTADGQAYGWGDNAYGQAMGADSLFDPNEPKPIGLSGVISMAAGCRFSCALLESTEVHCWGDNELGTLGDGTYGTDASRSHAQPVRDDNGDPFAGVVEIAAGTDNACARRGDDSVWCWGRARTAGVGTPHNAEPITAPRLVAQGATGIALGNSAGCLRRRDGTAWCWGGNAWGHAGEEPDAWPWLPTPHRIEEIGDALDVGVAIAHTCAIDAGFVRCWGGNFVGQLGLDDGCAENECPGSQSAVPLYPLGIFGPARQISMHWLYTCALTDQGVFCWGANDGSLGDGVTTRADVAIEVPFP
jgi:alpha-tubulin suppressor-like RCC1 family protein